MRKPLTHYKFPIVIERDADGYFAFCPHIQGCYSQGDTYEDSLKNIRDAIRGHIKESIANKEPITRTEDICKRQNNPFYQTVT